MKAVRVVRINSSCLRHCILRKHDPLRQTTISTLVGYRRQNRDKRFPNIKSSNFSDDRPPSPLLKRLPNIITSMRIAGCPFLAYAIANDMKGIALGGCLFAGATDWLDGFIARKYNAAVRCSIWHNLNIISHLLFYENRLLSALFLTRSLIKFSLGRLR